MYLYYYFYFCRFTLVSPRNYIVTLTLTLNKFHKQQTNIITLTSLQLHHNTYIIKLTSITSLHFNYITCSNLIASSNSITSYALIISLHHSPHYNHTAIPPVTIHLRISTGTQFPHSATTFLSPFQTFVPISISNDIWDTSKLLLLSGDGKTNLGLRPIDNNPVFCSICSSKINRGIQQDIAPMCSETDCNLQRRHACNDLTANQTLVENLVNVLLRANVLNMALLSLKLSSHLDQFLSYSSLCCR